MLRFEERSCVRCGENRIGNIKQSTRSPRGIVPRRINKSRWLCWMFAQYRRPTLRYSVGTTEQTGVCTDARQTTRAREIDESQGFGRL